MEFIYCIDRYILHYIIYGRVVDKNTYLNSFISQCSLEVCFKKLVVSKFVLEKSNLLNTV